MEREYNKDVDYNEFYNVTSYVTKIQFYGEDKDNKVINELFNRLTYLKGTKNYEKKFLSSLFNDIRSFFNGNESLFSNDSETIDDFLIPFSDSDTEKQIEDKIKNLWYYLSIYQEFDSIKNLSKNDNSENVIVFLDKFDTEYDIDQENDHIIESNSFVEYQNEYGVNRFFMLDSDIKKSTFNVEKDKKIYFSIYEDDWREDRVYFRVKFKDGNLYSNSLFESIHNVSFCG